MPAPIMPAPSTPMVFKFRRRHLLRAGSPFVGLLHVDEERADHVARGGIGHHFRHVARFDAQGGVDRHLHAFVDGGQDRLLRRIVLHRLGVDHGVADAEHLLAGAAVNAAARDLEVLFVPRLHGFAAVLDVGLGLGDQVRARHDFVDEAGLQRLDRG